MSQNLVSITITQEQQTTSLALVKQVSETLAGTVTLDPDERRALTLMGAGSDRFVRIVLLALQQNPDIVPRNLDVSLLTGVITTTTDESIEAARRLAAQEGIFCGISSGCNVAAALKLGRRHPDLGSIVTVINDTGQRYNPTAAASAYEQLMDWFGTHLS